MGYLLRLNINEYFLEIENLSELYNVDNLGYKLTITLNNKVIYYLFSTFEEQIYGLFLTYSELLKTYDIEKYQTLLNVN